MSENKDYIIQPQENGNVYISEEVLISITAVAVKEVEGVCSLAGSLSADIAGKLSKKNPIKGIKMTLKDSSVSVECNIIVLYGQPVVDIAANVQNSVAAAITSMTGLTVDDVNVNVCGIAMNK